MDAGPDPSVDVCVGVTGLVDTSVGMVVVDVGFVAGCVGKHSVPLPVAVAFTRYSPDTPPWPYPNSVFHMIMN